MTGKRVALVIGNNYPEWDKEKQLQFAVADAQKIKEILDNKDICEFDEVKDLLDRTSKEVSGEVETILKRSDTELVFIYFSGHGKKDHEDDLCLLFNDTKEDTLISTSLPFSTISKCMRYPYRKTVIIILDCCYSGLAGISDRDTDVMEALKEHSGSGTIIITSTGLMGSPKAKEDEKLRHGVFTYYLIEGLEKGNADENNDGIISITELFNYALKKVKESGCPQSPKIEQALEEAPTIVFGKNPLKIRKKDFDSNFDKLMDKYSEGILPELFNESLTVLIKESQNPSSLTEKDRKTLSFLKDFLKGNISVSNYNTIVQRLRNQCENSTFHYEKEITQKTEQKKAIESDSEVQQSNREEEETRKEEEKVKKKRKEQKRKEEEEKKNLLSAVKKPIESGSKAVYKRPMEEKDWDSLLQRIKDGKCTPFLGAGACVGKIPIGSQIANEWAKKYDYPMEDFYDLARVAQFVAVTKDAMIPKEEICYKIKELLEEVPPSYFENPYEPYSVLADLPLPVYITTNYDDLMVRALKSRGKTPNQEICRYKYTMQSKRTSLDYVPTPEKPLVYHLHGSYKEPQSLVLTEDDYLDFLVAISRNKKLLPPRIQEAFTNSSFLFLGYSIAEWDKVLFQLLAEYLEKSDRRHLSVQLVPGDVSEAQKEKVQKYLDRYFSEFNIQVYWQDCREFAEELRTRWEAFNLVP